jgi:putative membrane protein
MNMSRLWAAIALALLLPIGPIAAQQTQQSAGADRAAQAMPAQDRDFLREIALANELAIQQSLLAREHADRQDVKEFAQGAVDDHIEARDKIERVAKSLGMPLPQGIEVDQREKVRALILEGGDEFDPVYLLATIEGHQQAIALVEQEAEAGELPDMRGLAEELLPTLKDHLAQAQELAPELKVEKD